MTCLYKKCILEIATGKHTFSCEVINFAELSRALGLKSRKKNKLRRRRTYKRGKEGQFLPTPTKTHKRRHRTTHKSIDQLEKIRVKLRKELKPTRKRV